MLRDEKDQLLALFDAPKRWCRDVEACDAKGEPVSYDDITAVAWDITGALCHLFGWNRACELFGQIARQIKPATRRQAWESRDPSIEAMRTLQEFNDKEGMTFERLRTTLEALPIWSAGRRVEHGAG